MVREHAGFPLMQMVDTTDIKEQSFDRLAEACKEHLDMDAIVKLMN